ncbi:MAG: hypothetical protein AB8G22_01785 [Saprospiraceae bacterium]
MKPISFNFFLSLCFLFTLGCDTPKETSDNMEDDIPNRSECIDTKDVEATPWLRQAMKEHTPYNVVKYRYKTDGWAYQFTSANRYLYDCQGTLICVAKGKALDGCARKIMELEKAEKGVVIYNQKGNID